MNKILRFSICFLISVSLILCTCPISFASSPIYLQMPYSKPQLVGNDIYIEVLMKNASTGEYRGKSIYVCASQTYEFTDSGFNHEGLNIGLVMNSDAIDFNAVDVGAQWFNVVFTEITDDGKFVYYNYKVESEGNNLITRLLHTDYGSGFSAVAYRVYGNPASIIDNTNTSNYNFTFIYGEQNSTNQSIAQVINALSVLAQNDNAIKQKLDTMIESLNGFSGSFDEYVTFYKQQMEVFNEYLVDSLQTFRDLLEVTTSMSDTVFWIWEQLITCMMYLDDISVTLNSSVVPLLEEIRDLLKAGSDAPTLKDPNQAIDGAFNDVSGFFGDISGFGDELEANKGANQENLANAGMIINGFFNICPPQIIVALIFCAIMIVIAKVIGR